MLAVIVGLSLTIFGPPPAFGASPTPSATGDVLASYSYDTASNTRESTVAAAFGDARARSFAATSSVVSTGEVSAFPVDFVAAETAGTALDASELGAGQASNYARYVKKLPSGAQDPVITRGADGAVQFSADVPGRVPGSYAAYTKIVDSSGTTTDYFKTTVAPDGSIVHIKIKFP
ncbi:MAG TPA: hypothetical protein VK816_08620 [Jatrophihabitantaceae bacterium]|nr:hypothetical protein [Jatrophihabitantaceae bacterium]